MDNTMSRRLSVMGFVMTCIIAVYHFGSPEITISYLDEVWNANIHSLIEDAADLAITYFFAVSGFLLFRGLTFQNLGSKLKRRCMTLLVPFVLWQIIFTVWYRIFGTVWTVKDWFIALLLMTKPLPCGPLWYLHSLFILALLSPIWLLLFRNRKLAWWGALASILVSHWLFYDAPAEVRHIETISFIGNVIIRLPAYIMGAFYGYHADELKDTGGLRYLAGFIGLALLLESFGLLSFRESTMQMLPLFGLYLLPVNPRLSNLKIYKLTFLIYAIHMPLIGVLKFKILRLIALFTASAAITNVVSRSIFLAAVILCAAVGHWLLSRFCPKLLVLLTGGRC